MVEYLSQHLGVPAEEIATIGDQPNDVLMFKRSGFSIAMGNASDEVKAQAAAVTDSYNDEGFAKAMEAFILGYGEVAGAMGETIGRIEILPDPPALAHHVAEWMTQGGVGGGGRVPRVALRRLDAEGSLSAARLGRIPRPFSLAARLLVLGRRALRPLRSSREQLPDDPRSDARQGAGAAGEHPSRSDRRHS